MDGFMSDNIILVCEDSPVGIFTAIYEAYALRISHDRISLQLGETENFRLFSSYQKVLPDEEKAQKVMNTLKRRLDAKDYYDLWMALAANDNRKAQAVYQTVVWGLSGKAKGSILAHMADDNVRLVVELSRRAGNEMHRMREFLRFAELENGILYAVIGPKDNVLPMVTEHFADRLPMENFLIFDEFRNLYAIHPAGKEWFLMSGYEEKREENREIGNSAAEEYYQELFRGFCHSISIESRKNLKLQQNMLPLRFRPYMVEFLKK